MHLHKDGKYPILALISLSAIFSLGLLAARMLQTGTPNFFFMVWNLFLALLPIGFSLILTHKKNPKWLNWTALILWLSFFPNAPYMLTDLLHLRPRPEVPFWFDLMVFLSFAWTGLIAAYYSSFSTPHPPARIPIDCCVVLCCFCGSLASILPSGDDLSVQAINISLVFRL